MRTLNRIFFVFLLLQGPWSAAHAQDSLFRFIRTIPDTIVDFSVDNLDNIYLIRRSDQLKKLNNQGDSAAIFNDVKRFGKLTSIDVSNPLRILLYYKGFGTMVILDRFLNVRSSIDLRKMNLFQVSAIALSYDNNIWIFDLQENKLKKISEEGRVVQETADFRVLFNEAITPSQIFDSNGLVYLYDPEKGLFVFDYYGALKNRLPILHWENCKVAGTSVFGVTGDTLHRYQLDTFREWHWALPPQLLPFRKLSFTAQRLYALKKDGLEVYELN